MKYKENIRLSASLVCKVRRILKYSDSSKMSLVRIQAVHERIQPPKKRDHEAVREILTRMAQRLDVEVPKLADLPKRPAKRNKTYQTQTFTQWRLLRYEALKRADGRCECCGATAESSGEPLHVDHIKPKSVHPDIEYIVDDLQVLCIDCNIGKGNWDETNWREKRLEDEATIALDRELLAGKKLH